jgi:hypothetical protein
VRQRYGQLSLTRELTNYFIASTIIDTFMDKLIFESLWVTYALSYIHLFLLFLEDLIWSPSHGHKLEGIRRCRRAYFESTPVSGPVNDDERRAERLPPSARDLYFVISILGIREVIQVLF